MTYTETIDYLYTRLPMFQRVGAPAYKEGLDGTLALDSLLGHPHHQFRTIHVGGTNGKGSSSHTLSAVLQSAGYNVGLYTSPHLLDFRERIRVNGVPVSQQFVIDFVDKYRSDFEPISPSFFELTTLMAFSYFAQQKVDFAIVEVGLGGRLDSTNIITPILSLITNISLDHTQFLGSTPEAIAFEKAGIIKQGVPVVIGEASDEVRAVFQQKAESEKAPIVFAEDSPEIISAQLSKKGYLYETKHFANFVGELRGLAQVKNTNTVLTAIRLLREGGLQISNEAVYSGFQRVTRLTGLMGRWQRVQENPTLVLDTGHNEGGIRYVVEQLQVEQYAHLRMVFGMVADKDVSHVLALLPPNATYYFCKADIPRALEASELAEKAEEFGLRGKCFSTVPMALRQALDDASADDFVFVGGSNFVVADALAYLQKRTQKP